MADKSTAKQIYTRAFIALLVLYISIYATGFFIYIARLPSSNLLNFYLNLLPILAAIFYVSRFYKFEYEPNVGLKKFITIIFVLSAACLLFNYGSIFNNLRLDNVYISGKSNFIKILYFIGLVLVFPFVEEMFFRGYLYLYLKKSIGLVFSVIFTGIAFSFFHDLGFSNIIYFSILNIFFCMTTEWTGSFVGSYIVHAVYNVFWFSSNI